MDINAVHIAINVALIESAKRMLDEAKETEMNPRIIEAEKQRKRVQAIQAMDHVIKYLRGDVVITDGPGLTKALALEKKEPAWLQLEVDHQDILKELEKKNKLIHQLQKKVKKKPRGKGRPKKAPKKVPVEESWKCDCGREFKTDKGLKRHRASCKKAKA